MVVAPGAQAPPQIDVVNAKPGSSVVMRFDQAFGKAKVRILDCRGAQIIENIQDLSAGAHAWEVPPSGLLEIRRETGGK